MSYSPTPEQLEIINSTDSRYISAGPGTGKTTTALYLAGQEVLKLKPGQKILFLSYSNAAVQRMAESAGLQLNSSTKTKIDFNTFHSLSWKIIFTYGRYIGLPKKISVLDNIDSSLTGFLVARNENESDKEYYHRVARSTGKIHFDIMLELASRILKSSETIRGFYELKFPLIIVDEFQDTSSEQYDFLKSLGGKSRILLFGDQNQVIYDTEYSTVVSRKVDFLRWKNVQKENSFGVNHRCPNFEIIQFANNVLNGIKNESEKNGLQVFPYYYNQLRSNIASIYLQVQKAPELTGKSIGILTPSQGLAQDICNALKNPPDGSAFPVKIYPHFNLREENKESIRSLFMSFIQLKLDKNENNAIQTARSLVILLATWGRSKISETKVQEALKKINIQEKKVKKADSLQSIADSLRLESIEDDYRIFIEKIVASEFLKGIKDGISASSLNFLNAEMRISYKATTPYNNYLELRKPVGLYGSSAGKAKIEVVSMWRSKGREFDIAVMVVDPFALSQSNTEAMIRRLYYVAATRAKEHLIVLSCSRKGKKDFILN
ncbi:UvrD-helicase domain-containing protein [Bdellovibrio reynosensis]|uniref:DNA 3'-5' helicase II n=1 Tax=Bdellovibrio reynosensis TaxID=2835041 RepID=A0ABY4C929_9BACT|nr:ATP-dependent helicase [Bdellovibrio reynosensis]UOF01492.1 ATP-dependent helicase [Bdellovibrio reynosensis]